MGSSRWENEELANAIKSNNIEQVKKVLAKTDKYCRLMAAGTMIGPVPLKTALTYAMELGNREIVKELIEHGYSIYRGYYYNCFPTKAVERMKDFIYLNSAKYLENNAVDIASIEKQHQKALEQVEYYFSLVNDAIKNNDIEALKCLFENKILNPKNIYKAFGYEILQKNLFLCTALEGDNRDIIRMVLENGIDVNNRYISEFLVLLKGGQESLGIINQVFFTSTDIERVTPLMFLSALGDIDAVKELISKQPDKVKLHRKKTNIWTCEKDNSGKTAYDYAVMNGHKEIADIIQTEKESLEKELSDFECEKAYFSNCNEKSLKAKIKQNPDDPSAHFYLGVYYLERKMYEPAEERFLESINLNPKKPAPYVNLGILYGEQDNLKEARIWLNKALELDKENEDALAHLGWIYIMQDDYERAKWMLDTLKMINPKNADAYSKTGLLYLEQDNPEKALPEYKKAVELEPDDYAARYNLAWAYIEVKDYAPAESELKKVITRCSQDDLRQEAIDNLIELYNDTDRPDEAIKLRDKYKRTH